MTAQAGNIYMVYTNHGDKYINTRPRQIQFGTHAIHPRTWVEALRRFCDIVAFEHPKDFARVLAQVGWSRRPYFVQGSMHGHIRPHLVQSTDINVECNLSANNIVSLLNAVSRLFGYGPVTVELW